MTSPCNAIPGGTEMKQLFTTVSRLLSVSGNCVFSLLLLTICFLPVRAIADTAPAEKVAAASDNDSSSEGSDTALPDLFSGTMTYKIPIEVPAGRNGMKPDIALKYRSINGNGWIGVGWELELGSIQRSVKNSVNYSDDKYHLNP
jgi:hypothetical protein